MNVQRPGLRCRGRSPRRARLMTDYAPAGPVTCERCTLRRSPKRIRERKGDFFSAAFKLRVKLPRAPCAGVSSRVGRVRPLSLLLGRLGRWSDREIARPALSLARSAQAERDNESCYFLAHGLMEHGRLPSGDEFDAMFRLENSPCYDCVWNRSEMPEGNI
ncbi:hypothetical protein EVAR_92865_1 [Eumeta japonica]|uniref:Uncharacterized protein n=1 Tax=Eumeta variegata TaxID=151549 RepID=A0A4C1TD65_EUMVA|nr:hypothetical protein EVAR_92865_1 [Eumeta japonica]